MRRANAASTLSRCLEVVRLLHRHKLGPGAVLDLLRDGLRLHERLERQEELQADRELPWWVYRQDLP